MQILNRGKRNLTYKIRYKTWQEPEGSPESSRNPRSHHSPCRLEEKGSQTLAKGLSFLRFLSFLADYIPW